jgi:hypothetical protein
MNPIEDVLSQMMGIDKNHEIFNLWYEVTYLRILLGHVVANAEGVSLNENILIGARIAAQSEVMRKFPMCTITFPDSENKKEGENK